MRATRRHVLRACTPHAYTRSSRPAYTAQDAQDAREQNLYIKNVDCNRNGFTVAADGAWLQFFQLFLVQQQPAEQQDVLALT